MSVCASPRDTSDGLPFCFTARCLSLANSNSTGFGASCRLANARIGGHVQRNHGDLRSHRPSIVDLSPRRCTRWRSCGDRRVTPSETSADRPQPSAQKSSETHALGSAPVRHRCLLGRSQSPPQDCDWNPAVDAAALSPGADPAEIPTPIHAPNPSATRAQRALEATHRGDSRNEASQSAIRVSANCPAYPSCPALTRSSNH